MGGEKGQRALASCVQAGLGLGLGWPRRKGDGKVNISNTYILGTSTQQQRRPSVDVARLGDSCSKLPAWVTLMGPGRAGRGGERVVMW